MIFLEYYGILLVEIFAWLYMTSQISVCFNSKSRHSQMKIVTLKYSNHVLALFFVAKACNFLLFANASIAYFSTDDVVTPH